ncbi:MAG TPA: HEPN domain-containing protein [Clostridiaceae bacterium]
MVEKEIELSKYRLDKAKEDLETAKANFEQLFLKAAINRSYYSIFHAVRSVLALDGYDSRKHSGIIAYFNQNYIKTNKFPKEMSKILTSASSVRNKSDYDDFFIVGRDEVEKQINNAEVFIIKIEQYLEVLYIIN